MFFGEEYLVDPSTHADTLNAGRIQVKVAFKKRVCDGRFVPNTKKRKTQVELEGRRVVGLFRLPSGKYTIERTFEGKRWRLPTSCYTLRGALRVYEEFEVDPRAAALKHSGVTVGELVEAYLTSKRASGLAESTMLASAVSLRKMVGAVPSRSAEVTIEHLEKIQRQHLDAGKERSTVALEMRRIKAFWRWAARAGKVGTNPAADLSVVRVDKKSKDYRRIVPLGDIRALETTADLKAVLVSLWSTGLRIGELRALQASNLHPDQGYIHVARSKTRTGRDVPVRHPVAWKALFRTVRDAFPRGRYDKRALFRLELAEACQRAGVEPFTFHGLRHSRISIWAARIGFDAAFSLVNVSMWAGHGDARTTETYLHPTCRVEASYLDEELFDSDLDGPDSPPRQPPRQPPRRPPVAPRAPQAEIEGPRYLRSLNRGAGRSRRKRPTECVEVDSSAETQSNV